MTFPEPQDIDHDPGVWGTLSGPDARRGWPAPLAPALTDWERREILGDDFVDAYYP